MPLLTVCFGACLQSEEVETSLARPSAEVCSHLGVECFYDREGGNFGTGSVGILTRRGNLRLD